MIKYFFYKELFIAFLMLLIFQKINFDYLDYFSRTHIRGPYTDEDTILADLES